jgi:hypothetical protein
VAANGRASGDDAIRAKRRTSGSCEARPSFDPAAKSLEQRAQNGTVTGTQQPV